MDIYIFTLWYDSKASFMCAICTGCKFAPGVYFWPCERCFKNLHPGANLHLLLPSRGCKFICTRVQIITHYLNLYGYRRSPPPTHTVLESKHQARYEHVRFVCKQSIYRTSRLSFVDFSLLRLFKKSKLSVTGQKNGH